MLGFGCRSATVQKRCGCEEQLRRLVPRALSNQVCTLVMVYCGNNWSLGIRKEGAPGSQ